MYLLKTRDGTIQDPRFLMHHVQSTYHDTTIHHRLIKSIRSLSIYITESNKMISSSIDPRLLPYCTSVFSYYSQQKYHFKLLSITKIYLLITPQQCNNISMHLYLALYWYTQWNTVHHDASQYHPISTTTLLRIIPVDIIFYTEAIHTHDHITQ